MAYQPIPSTQLVTLVKRLSRGLPPVLASVDKDGKPLLSELQISQPLYAGWVYWMGREKLKSEDGFVPLDFLTINKLSERALLQQCAIDLVLGAGIP